MSRAPEHVSRDLIPLSSTDLGEVKAALRTPRAMQAIQSSDERLIVSPGTSSVLRSGDWLQIGRIRLRFVLGSNPWVEGS